MAPLLFKILHKLCFIRPQGRKRQTRRPRCNAGTVERYTHSTQHSYSLSGALHRGRADGAPPGPKGLGRSGKGPLAPFLVPPSLPLLGTVLTVPGNQLGVCSHTHNSLPSWITQQWAGGWTTWMVLHADSLVRGISIRWGCPEWQITAFPLPLLFLHLHEIASKYPKKYCHVWGDPAAAASIGQDAQAVLHSCWSRGERGTLDSTLPLILLQEPSSVDAQAGWE